MGGGGHSIGGGSGVEGGGGHGRHVSVPSLVGMDNGEAMSKISTDSLDVPIVG